MASQQDKNTEPTLSGTSMEGAKRLVDKMTIGKKTMQLSCIYSMGLIGMDGPVRLRFADLFAMTIFRQKFQTTWK